jgi:hypothetical protein
MWPPPILKLLGDTKVVDVGIANKYFIQLLLTDVKIWVCFNVFITGQIKLEFVSEKCYSLPSYVRILPDTKIFILESNSNFEDTKGLA